MVKPHHLFRLLPRSKDISSVLVMWKSYSVRRTISRWLHWLFDLLCLIWNTPYVHILYDSARVIMDTIHFCCCIRLMYITVKLSIRLSLQCDIYVRILLRRGTSRWCELVTSTRLRYLFTISVVTTRSIHVILHEGNTYYFSMILVANLNILEKITRVGRHNCTFHAVRRRW